ncbi:MAG TPA: hypothetical protein ENN39_10110 [Desulfonatronum sp.]|nr:hypothetical protein [Desulfonatronum sp.]
MNLTERLISIAHPLGDDLRVQDVRIGLGYTCVELDDGSAGLACTPVRGHSGSCTHLKRAGSLSGLAAKELLEGLQSDHPLERAIGLAVCNALNQRFDSRYLDEDSMALLDIREDDHVVMVGFFGPLISRIKATGCRLDIVERDADKPGVIDSEKGHEVLAQCDVAIITSTSIINNTVDDLLSALRKTRSAVMLGPSTPLFPQAFAGTRITQLSGAHVMDKEKVKMTVSQGGGTMLLKRHLRFVSLPVS